MAIKWTVSHPDRLITAVGEIPVKRDQIAHCTDEVVKAGLGRYRKLFDLTRLTTSLSRTDTRLAGARMMQHAYGHAFGPIAMVVSNEVVAESAGIFQAVSGADRHVPNLPRPLCGPGLAGRDGACLSDFSGCCR